MVFEPEAGGGAGAVLGVGAKDKPGERSPGEEQDAGDTYQCWGFAAQAGVVNANAHGEGQQGKKAHQDDYEHERAEKIFESFRHRQILDERIALAESVLL